MLYYSLIEDPNICTYISEKIPCKHLEAMAPGPKIAYFHGCHDYYGNSYHVYKESIELTSKQSVLLNHSYHHVHGLCGYNWSFSYS